MTTLYDYQLFPSTTTATVEGESLANKYGIIENTTGYIFALCNTEQEAIHYIKSLEK